MGDMLPSILPLILFALLLFACGVITGAFVATAGLDHKRDRRTKCS